MSAVISQEAKWLLAILLKYGEILFSTCCYYYWCHKLILTKCIWKRALKDLIFGMSGQVNCNCSPVSLDSWHHLMRLIHFGLVSVSLTCFSISVQRLCLCSGLQRRPTAAPFEGSSTLASPGTYIDKPDQEYSEYMADNLKQLDTLFWYERITWLTVPLQSW